MEIQMAGHCSTDTDHSSSQLYWLPALVFPGRLQYIPASQTTLQLK